MRRSRAFRLRDAGAHLGVGLDVFHLVIIHHAETAAAERFGQSERHLGLRLDDFGLHFRDTGDHFLFERDGGGAADFGLGLGHVLVSLGLRFLKLRADVLSDIHVGDVDG